MERLHEIYRKLRNNPPIICDHTAKWCLDVARGIESFENNPQLRLIARRDSDPDASFYDTWPHLSQQSKENLKRQYYDDCWVVELQQFTHGSWETIESIGNCSGYEDPTSPFENCYVAKWMTNLQFDAPRLVFEDLGCQLREKTTEKIDSLVLFAKNDRETYHAIQAAFKQSRRAIDRAAVKLAKSNAQWHDDPSADDHGEYHAHPSIQFGEETRAAAIMVLLADCEACRYEDILNS